MMAEWSVCWTCNLSNDRFTLGYSVRLSTFANHQHWNVQEMYLKSYYLEESRCILSRVSAVQLLKKVSELVGYVGDSYCFGKVLKQQELSTSIGYSE